MKNHPFPDSAHWIWRPAEPGINEFVCFRREFTLNRVPETARLHIAVDSDYRLRVNETEVWGRQFSDYPRHRSFNTHEVSSLLCEGRNLLTVLGYYRGQSSSEHRAGRAGLLLFLDAGETRVVSDRNWLTRLSPSHRSGVLPKVTPQMGFTTEYDARLEDQWESSQHTCGGAWDFAAERAAPTDGFWQALRPRPLPMLERGTLVSARVVERGRWAPPATTLSPAETVDAGARHRDDAAPPDQPWYAIADLGCEEVGLLFLDIEAQAGTVVEVAHGEHLVDGHVRALLGSRQFADRIICRAGRQSYVLPFRRLGCRYLEVYVRGHSGPVRLHETGLLPVFYPLPERSAACVQDPRWEAVDRVACRTLELCMHEHYEDCPWREQALYAFDSRNQALYGYYAFGEYDFPRESFRLLGWGAGEDGLLELTAPAKVRITIPIFSLAWICELREHWLFSGDLGLWNEFRNAVSGILDAFLRNRDSETGLARLFEGERYWTFYEWAPDMQTREVDPPGRIDAPHNLFLIEALDAASDMREAAGAETPHWRGVADELRQAVHTVFWNRGEEAYHTFYEKKRGAWHVAQTTQALALTQGLPGWPALELGGETTVRMTLSTLPYAARAMLGASPDRQRRFLRYCRNLFGGMLDQGATSLWETANGASDFGGAGSLCHGWSSLPVWLLRAYVLGVRPLSPGFRDVAIAPHPGDYMSASGEVPTPHGPIKVEWHRDGDRIRLAYRAPESCRITVRSSHPEFSCTVVSPDQ